MTLRTDYLLPSSANTHARSNTLRQRYPRGMSSSTNGGKRWFDVPTRKAIDQSLSVQLLILESLTAIELCKKMVLL